ncbi:hypothetical protein J6590_000356 [Homalodisca vitripennis]|nr:hypothetical protein J6590_000356 [Homalodisca vitripennis]
MSQKWIKKTNKFSVSLQMAKATEKANIQEFQVPKNIQRSKQNSHLPEPSPTPVNDNLAHSLVTKTQGMGKMSPPCTAQVLSEGETYEEFLTKHLDKYSKRGNILTTGHSLSMTNFNCTEGASQTLSKKLSQNTTEGASQTLSKRLNQNTTEGASQTLPKKLNQNTAGEVPPTLTGQLNDNLELISQSDQPMKSPLPRQISPETQHLHFLEMTQRKRKRLSHFLANHRPDLLIPTEHGLTQDNLENTRIDGYTLIGGFCRKLHKKGGVAGYVKNELEKTIKLIRTSNEESELVCETAFFKIKINKEVIQVLGTYRPPTSNIEQSIDILTDQLESAMQTTKPMVIVGDINVDNLPSKRQ